MTRRQRRFERRSAARIEKRIAFYSKYDDFNNVCNRKNLFYAADVAKKHVMWKGTVQRWSMSQLLETEKLYRDIRQGKDVRRGFSRFLIWERGKVRQISAVRFYERVAQKCLCRNVLYPAFTRSLIFDNSASQGGKGVKFASDRMTTCLRRHFRNNGTEGYILLMDFKGYFENINHDVAKGLYKKILKDKRLINMVDNFIDAYGEKGLGLGSETSQMHAIFYPNKIDHCVTETSRERIFYGRYMDDSFVIARNKETLICILQKIKEWCARLKIMLSPKKTMIVKISKGFTWLKTRFFLTQNGKIVRKPTQKNIVRERRRLKRQIKLVKDGVLSKSDLIQSFESWIGSMKRRNARLSVWKMRQILWSAKI